MEEIEKNKVEIKKANSHSGKNIIFPTGLRFEDKYPDSYHYTPPDSMKNLEIFFMGDKESPKKRSKK